MTSDDSGSSSTPRRDAAEIVALRTFGGPAPGLAGELLTLRELPASAREALWDLVAPNLGETVGSSAHPLAQQFASAHGVEVEGLIPLVRGCRRLFRQAAQMDLPVETVHKDVLLLTNDREVSRRIAACYTMALPTIRTAAVLTSLKRFGPELIDVGLRMDHVATSRQTPNKMVPIAMLSLRYREGDDTKNVTLQVAPPVLKRLRDMLDGVFK